MWVLFFCVGKSSKEFMKQLSFNSALGLTKTVYKPVLFSLFMYDRI